jgi:hypothetical protein
VCWLEKRRTISRPDPNPRRDQNHEATTHAGLQVPLAALRVVILEVAAILRPASVDRRPAAGDPRPQTNRYFMTIGDLFDPFPPPEWRVGPLSWSNGGQNGGQRVAGDALRTPAKRICSDPLKSSNVVKMVVKPSPARLAKVKIP